MTSPLVKKSKKVKKKNCLQFFFFCLKTQVFHAADYGKCLMCDTRERNYKHSKDTHVLQRACKCGKLAKALKVKHQRVTERERGKIKVREEDIFTSLKIYIALD